MVPARPFTKWLPDSAERHQLSLHRLRHIQTRAAQPEDPHAEQDDRKPRYPHQQLANLGPARAQPVRMMRPMSTSYRRGAAAGGGVFGARGWTGGPAPSSPGLVGSPHSSSWPPVARDIRQLITPLSQGEMLGVSLGGCETKRRETPSASALAYCVTSITSDCDLLCCRY